MAKISTILIGVLLVGFMATFFTVLLADASDKYNVVVDNETADSLSRFQSQSDRVQGLSKNVSDEVLNSSQGRDTTDLLGGLFQSGFSAILLTKDSFSVVEDVSTEGVESLKLGPTLSNSLVLLIGGIITVVIIIGIVLSVLVRKDI